YREDDFAAVVVARRGEAKADSAYVASPLRAADCSTLCSGAAAIVLTTEAALPGSVARPAWITGLDQRIERRSLGARDLSVSATPRAIAQGLGLAGSSIDVLEVHAPFSHQELVILDAIGAGQVGAINPSGGALPADPVMTTGLIRIGAAAEAVLAGTA